VKNTATQAAEPADLLDRAKEIPPRLSPETDLPMLFGATTSANPFRDTKPDNTKPGATLRVVSYVKTFVLWRPWTKCQRCLNAIDRGEIVLPEEAGDHTCVHVQVSEYKHHKDRVLRGEGVKEFEEHFQLHDGTRCVIFGWLEADPTFLEEQKKRAEKKQNESVYPPNVTAAFADPIDKIRERVSKA